MVTKERLVGDIELQLLQSAPSDDSELEQDQIVEWIMDYLHDLIRREILDEQRKGNSIPPIYVVRETGLDMDEENVEDVDDVKQRLFVELAAEVLDLPKDGGLVRVLDYDLNLIHKTTLEQLESLRDMRHAKPSTENVLYYRQGKKVFIEGFNTADIDFNPIIVDYVAKQDVAAMAATDEVLITDQLLPILKDMVVQRGKLMLYGTQPDPHNDGVDHKTPAYHLAISNPVAAASQQPPPANQPVQ